MLEMEREVSTLKNRLEVVEKENHSTNTDLAVIKQRMGYMESKIDEIHKVIMKPAKITPT